ncbi:MAG: ExeM/NucH family extracellular endonuclease, partial [Anaerolineales bacterium]
MNAKHPYIVVSMLVLFTLSIFIAGPGAKADTNGFLDFTIWDFEGATTEPSLDLTGNAQASAGSELGNESFVAGNPAGTSGTSWSFNNWSLENTLDANRYFEFKVDLSDYANITLTFAERRSSTGPLTFEIHYSTDGLNFFLINGTVTELPSNTSWRTHTFDFSDINSAISGQPSVQFRIYGYDASGSLGTWRIDDVTFNGESGTLPPPPPIVDFTIWDFEGATTEPSLDLTGNAQASAGSELGNESFVAGNPAGTSGTSWSFNNWSLENTLDANRYFEFKVDLSDYANITLTFAERRSSTGPLTFEIHYSTDGLNFFLINGTVTELPSNTSWRTHTFDFSDINSAISGQPSVQFRIYGYDASSNLGTWRIDDVTFNGESDFQPPLVDLSVSKSGPTYTFPGDQFDYSIIVRNLGTSSADDVLITDTLPAELLYVSYTSSSPITLISDTEPEIAWDAGTLYAGDQLTINLTVTVTSNFSQPITNTVFVSTSTPGDDPANNLATAITSPPPGGFCGDPFTPIYDIQGNGNVSPLIGQTLATEGVVVGDFSGPDRLNGFFIQDPIGDGDDLTSDGIFVYLPPANPFHTTPVSEGDLIRLHAQVGEFFNMTQLDFVESLLFCETEISIEPTIVNLPVPEPVDGVPYLERYEGMLVTFPQELTVTDNFNLGRYGEVTLSVDGRLFNPTNTADPGADANALQDLNDRRQIMLDDGSNLQNPEPPPPYFMDDGTLRAGDTTIDLTGVINFAFSVYRLQPTSPVEFTRVNQRSEFPQDVGGTIRIASFNVLNYFTTLDTGVPICGPNQDQDCRGANTPEEFERQRVKIIEAILRLDADVIGLIELENNPYESLQDLVNGLNDATEPGTYDFINTGTIGGDAIKQGIIYIPARVTPIGDFAILDSSVDGRFLDDKNRPVLAQTFDASGEIFTVAVNHLKSKGSDCNDVGDPDLGDGQGNCNLTRTNAALALVDWLASDPTGSGDPDYFIIGDLNAYRNEDPINAIREEGGFIDLIDEFLGPQAYSYVFFGQAGYLDHALASPALADRVTG